MKKCNLLLVLLVSLLFLSACSSNHSMTYPFDIRVENTWAIQDDSDIVFSIAEDTLTPSGVNYTMQNNSDQPFYFGSPYFIQYKFDETWYSFIDEADWTMELYQLDPGKSLTFSADWTYLYGALPAGQYRFVKPFFTQPGNQDIHYAFEFSVS